MVRLRLRPRRDEYASGREFLEAVAADARHELACVAHVRDLLESGVRPRGISDAIVADIMVLDFPRAPIRLEFEADGGVVLVVR